MRKVRLKAKGITSVRFMALGKGKTLPPHRWEAHPLAHPGEANRAFAITIVVIMVAVIFSLLLFSEKQLAGEASLTGADVVATDQCIDITGYLDNDHDGKGKFSAEPETLCTIDGIVPSGYASNHDDCFDADQQKVCEPGMKCVAENTCDWICSGKNCTPGTKYCEDNSIKECKETGNYCREWISTVCDPRICQTTNSTVFCKSTACISNAECESGWCQNGKCLSLSSNSVSSVEEGISLSLINLENNLQVAADSKLSNEKEYLILVRVRSPETLPNGHLVSVSVSYQNQPQVTRYWTMEPTLKAGELEVVAFRHKVPEYKDTWGKVTITASVEEYWSSGNLNLLEPLEEEYAIQ